MVILTIVYSIGLLVILSSFIWALSKRKYNIAIGLFITAVAYAVMTFILRGG
jgi:uncharacterized membrane protein YhfC